MIQKIFTIVLPLLLPVMLYILYSVTLGRQKNGVDQEEIPEPITKQKGFVVSLFIGVVLMISVLIFSALQPGTDPSARYVPPKYKDGKIEPGHFEKQ